MNDKEKNFIEQVYKSNIAGSIAANKKIIELYGTDAAVLFGELLSKQKYFTDRGRLDEKGYFFNSRQQLKDATGLGRWTQNRVLPRLIKAGLLDMQYYKGRARRFKINLVDALKILENNPVEIQPTQDSNPVENQPTSESNHVENQPTPRLENNLLPGWNSTANNSFNNFDINNLKESAPPESSINTNDKNPKTCSEGKPTELNQLIGHYIKLFKEYTGKEPFIKRGQDHKLLKDVLNNLGLDESKRLLELYFKTADDFTTDKVGYSIGFFVKNINSLIAKGDGNYSDMPKNVRDALKLVDKYSKPKPIEHYSYQDKLEAGLLDDCEIYKVREQGKEHLQTIKSGLIAANSEHEDISE